MHRIFISDLHLDDPQALAFSRFSECLAAEASNADEIYILGDLVEMWIGDDDDSESATLLRATLSATTAICPVFIMHGNRDFLFGQAFAESTGVTLIDDPYLTPDGILLSHGDALCTDDEEYQALRAILRSDQWQNDILDKSLSERKAFGDGLRAQSKTANANKATNIMDVNARATDDLLAAHTANRLIHGHTHRPGEHTYASYTRFVTGAWERCGWLCRQRGSELTLECFTLARRYGT
jgi:UDP-2,3-diacylglucosamine hydrolase